MTSVPVINTNLSRSEALHQIVDSLNHLNTIVNIAVHTISARIAQESESLTSISRRIDDAYSKTAMIAAHQQKSTTVYSSSHFPSPASHQESMLLNTDAAKHATVTRVQRANRKLSMKQRNERAGPTTTFLTLKPIATVDVPSGDSNKCFPNWIESVDDLLVFDTNCNAYAMPPSVSGRMQVTSRRSIRHRRKASAKLPKSSQKKLSDPPKSIADPRCPFLVNTKKMNYVPEAAKMSMPQLQFKADVNLFSDSGSRLVAVHDIRWTGDSRDDANDARCVPGNVLNPDLCFQDEQSAHAESDESEEKQVLDQHLGHHYPTPQQEQMPEEPSVGTNTDDVHVQLLPVPYVDEVEAHDMPSQVIVSAQSVAVPHENEVSVPVSANEDVHALIEAKEQLVHHAESQQQDAGCENDHQPAGPENSIADQIEEAMKQRRPYLSDGDDDSESQSDFDF